MTEEQKLAQKKRSREHYLRNRDKILERTRDYYHANKDRYCELERERYKRDRTKRIAAAKARGKKHREWAKKLKATFSCMECGESHPATLDFHHRDPATKEYNVARLLSTTMARKKILAEIEKCDVLCANCHRKLHYQTI